MHLVVRCNTFSSEIGNLKTIRGNSGLKRKSANMNPSGDKVLVHLFLRSYLAFIEYGNLENYAWPQESKRNDAKRSLCV